MKTITISIFFLIAFLPSSGNCQKKISNIGQTISVSGYSKTGFIHNEGIDYFIQRNDKVTKVSKLEGDIITHLYDITDKPVDDGPIINLNSTDINKSGLLHRDRFYFEFYVDHIYVFDITTGSTVQIIESEDFNISFTDVVQLTNTKMVLRCFDYNLAEFSFDPYSTYILDLEEWSLERVAEEVNFYSSYIMDDLIYYTSRDGYSLVTYNLTNKEIKTIFNSTGYISISNQTFHNKKPTLYFKTEFNEYFYITEDHQIKNISCLDLNHRDVGNMCIRDSFLLFEYEINRALNLRIVNLNDCIRLGTGPFWGDQSASLGRTLFHDSYYLDSHQLLIENSSKNFARGHFHIIELSQTELSKSYSMDIRTDNRFDVNFTIYGSKLYLTNFNIDSLGANYEFITYDIYSKTKSVERYSSNLTHAPFILGENNPSNPFYIYGDPFKLMNYDTSSHENTIIESYGKEKLSGLNNIIRETKVDSSFFFSTSSNGIYKIKNDSVYQLGNLRNSYQLSSHEDNLFFSARNSDQTAEYLRHSLSEETTIKDTIKEVREKEGKLLSHYYFDLDKSPFYFDLNDGSKHSPIFEGDSISKIHNVALSGNNILMQVVQNVTWKNLLWNTRTNSLKEVKPAYHSQSFIPAKNGSFFIVTFNRTTDNEIVKIDSNGLTSEIIPLSETYSRLLYDDFDRNKSDLNYFIIPGNNKYRLFLESENGIIDYTVPYAYLHNETFQKNNQVLIKVKDGLLYFSEKDTPIDIEFDAYNKSLLNVLFEEDEVILFFKESSFGTEKPSTIMDIYSFSITDHGLTMVNSVPISKRGSLTHENEKLPEGNYAIFYNDGLLGLEPYIFNPDNYSFEIHQDLNPGSCGSALNNLVKINEDIYFTAYLDHGRQWYKWIDINNDDDNPDVNPSPEINISILPNPTANAITLSENYDSVSIFDMQGKLILLIPSYEKGQKIDIHDFPSGTYAVSILKEDKFVVELFVKE